MKIYDRCVCVCVCVRACVCLCVGHTPAGLEMVTMRPLACRSSGRKLLVTLSVPKKLTSIQPRKFDISDSSASPKFTHTPALFTNPHRPAHTETEQRCVYTVDFFATNQ